MQSIKDRLQARENASIQFDRKGAFKTRLVLRLRQQFLEFD
jgi:hypothetical protein